MPLSNTEAEIGLVAALAADVFCEFDGIRLRVSPDDFECCDAKRIFQAMGNVYQRDKALPDKMAIVAELTAMGVIGDIEDEVIDAIYASKPSGNVETLIDHVLESSLLRRGYAAAKDFARATKDPALSASNSLIELRSRIDAIIRSQPVGDIRHISEVVSEIISGAEKVMSSGSLPSVSLPFSFMNTEMGEVEFGQLVVIGAATSHGKSAFSYQWAECVAKNQRVPVGVISLEMKDTALVRRRLGADTGVGSRKIAMAKDLSPTDYAVMKAYEHGSKKWPIYISSRSSRKLSDILRWMSGAIREYGCRFLVVDYIQLIQADKNTGNRTEQLEHIANDLQSFAIDNDVIVVVPSQINRSGKDREDKSPTNDDLRGSGGIGQSADLVFTLNRESAHLPPERRPEMHEVHDVRINVTKNRNDATPALKIGWIPKEARFVPIDLNGI